MRPTNVITFRYHSPLDICVVPRLHSHCKTNTSTDLPGSYYQDVRWTRNTNIKTNGFERSPYRHARIAWSSNSCDWLGYGLAVSRAWNFSTTQSLTVSELPGRCITPLTAGLNFQSTCIHERQSNLSPLNNSSSGVGDAPSVSPTWSFR